MTQLESSERHNPALTLVDDLPLFSAEVKREAKKKNAGPSPVEERLLTLHPDDMTPMQALETLYDLKRLSVDGPGQKSGS